MTEIVTAPDAPLDTNPTPPAAGIAEAGVALRASGWGAPDPETTPTPADAAPAPAAGPAAGEATAEPSFTQDEQGKWHRPDGQFANAEEVAALNALPADDAPAAPADPAVPEPIVVALRGRDGADLEIEVTDPKVAELIRANHKDGMRREEFARQSEALQADRVGIEEFKTALRTNPESVILNEIPQEKQIAVAVALIAQHWDAISEQLVAFDKDPTERLKAAMKTQATIREQEQQTARAVQTKTYSSQVYTAVSALVPDSVDDATREQFISDAAADIGRAIEANGKQPVPVEKIPEIVARRVALYRFAEATGPTPSAPAAPARPLARPLVRPNAPAPAASVPVPGANAGATVRRTVQAQRIARAVAPQGAGAATVKAPLVPATADVTAASAEMRKQKGWGLNP